MDLRPYKNRRSLEGLSFENVVVLWNWSHCNYANKVIVHKVIFIFLIASEAIIVNGDRCRRMVIVFLLPELMIMDLKDIWFQQYGVTSHNTSHNWFLETIMSLTNNLQKRWCHLGTCDSTPWEYFLCSYVKIQDYKNISHSIPELKIENIRVISEGLNYVKMSFKIYNKKSTSVEPQ